MEFEEKLKEFSTRLNNLKDSISTEEATKTSMIMPFFQLLGYDIFNPNEFIPEFTADVGIKKGEKVDYAIVLNNEVTILIEAKNVGTSLQKHDSQLFRYFGTTTAKLAILTNGLIYKFYTDIDQTNKMDSTPFLEIDLSNLKDSDIAEVSKFTKENFDISTILSTASNLKYVNSIEKVLLEEFSNPSDDFIKLILNKCVYDGLKTQNVIDKYKPILKKSLNHYINKQINERLQKALNNTTQTDITNNEEAETHDDEGIVTTKDELESYYIVKAILSELVTPDKLYYKDTYSYFGILYDNKVTKWICRVYLKENVKFIVIPDSEKNEVRYEIQNVSNIYKLKDKLIERLNTFISK